MFDFGYNDIAICNGICTKSIMRNVARNQIGVRDINIIDTTPVPSRKRKYSSHVTKDDDKGGKKSKSLLSST